MTATRGRRWQKFSLAETLLISIFVGFCVWIVGRTEAHWLSPEAVRFAEVYGPERNSWHAEEWLIRDFFMDRRGGIFVDVVANHYQESSNTYYLETELGWSGLAIEPLLQFEPDYATYRPRTLFLPFFVSDESNAEATMFLVDGNHTVTSARRNFAERYART